MSNRFRRLTDLFTVGKAVPLEDGTYLWVQALNSYQRDECISDAQIARSRLVMALREKGDERLKIEGRFYEQGRDKLVKDLAEHRASQKVGDYLDEMREDPEWKERMDILMRTDPEDTAKPITGEELTLLSKINQDVINEMRKRELDETDFITRKLERLSDEELIDEFTEDWLDRRGTDLASGEYRLTETWYATRYCSATKVDDELDHSSCEGHSTRVFESRADVREAPNELISLIQVALADLNVTGRDPKDSASAESSSDSPPTQKEAEESAPSTSTEPQNAPLGT